MTRTCLALVIMAGLAACQSLPGSDRPSATDTPQPAADVDLFTVEIERAYTLEDPREDAFRGQIRAAAQENCGPGSGYALYAQRPVGDEVIGEEFLFRRYEITFACDR